MKHLIRLLRFLIKHKLSLGLALICMVWVSLTTGIQAYLIKPLFDQVLLPKAASFGLKGGIVGLLEKGYQFFYQKVQAQGIGGRSAAAFIILSVVLLKNICLFGSRYFFARVGLGLIRDIRNFLYTNLVDKPVAFFTRHSTGELVSRIVNDVLFIEQAMAERLGDLVQESITLMGLFILVFSYSPQLSLIILFIMPLALYPIVRFARSLRKASRRSQEKMADIAASLTETFQGHRIIKAFNWEAEKIRSFRDLVQAHYKASMKARIIQALNAPIVETFGMVLALGLFVYAGKMIASGVMSPGVFMSFLGALFMMYSPIKKLNKVNLALQQAVVAGDRIFTLTDIPDEYTQDGSQVFEGLKHSVEYRKVSFAYEGAPFPAIHDISFTLPKGKVLALVGESGSGKSTIASLLLRFFDPQEGAIMIDHQDIRSFQKKSLRQSIGLVTQDVILFQDTIYRNLTGGREDIPLEKVKEVAKKAHADAFIQELPQGYFSVLAEGGKTLSGGERQRLSIARALLKDPDILILDEATSQLDSQSEKLVQEALAELMKGRTTLLIAHRLATIRHADRILVLDKGRIVEQGTHEELMAAQKVYHRLYTLQMSEAS